MNGAATIWSTGVRVTHYLLSLKFSAGLGVLAILTSLLLADKGHATRNDARIAGMCDQAAIRASRTVGVPLDVLWAISRAETGRPTESGLQPWPWTVNMEGTGHWFSTFDEAQDYISIHYRSGARSFDVGCFQINFKWHGSAFRSFEDMFDPDKNAKYAAEYLTELFQEFGSWSEAVGAYHSRTPSFAERYIARFERIRSGLEDSTEALRANTNYRLNNREPDARELSLSTGSRPLVDNGVLTLGSLVPIVRQLDAGQHPFVLLE